jgi:DNA-binding LacI/PurR family transcriptional regulator
LSYCHIIFVVEISDRGPRYRQIYEALEQDIRSGRWKSGERLPSEADLVRAFGASRITVGRALRDLKLAGLVTRRAGSGTYVEASARNPHALSFGLLIPDLGDTEIFEAICQGMTVSPLAREHALLWGSNSGGQAKEERAWDLCRQYIERKVAGVFFAPLELTPAKDAVNRRIAQALDDARIPVVLLDRPLGPYPERGHHDLVALDNRRAGYVAAEHLLGRHARRIAFVGVPHAAASVDARAAGYREALFDHGAPFEPHFVQRIDPGDAAGVRTLMDQLRPDAVVCANDRTAARLMRTLLDLGYELPDQLRLVGVDDLEYAALLPVPLTTIRQPTRHIGAAALAAMLDRVAGSDLPTRDILLQGTLVVRQSCGSAGPLQAAG